jgi:glucosamine--fructose-6-phosphate aminotransferase (isomerizing)
MPKEVKTLIEILNQPEVWQRCIRDVSNLDLGAMLEKYDPRETPWVFVGCGTSYYLAQAAAASFTQLLQSPASAVPASEILLQARLVFPVADKTCFPVLISRSGHTSEVLQVAEYLKARGIEFLAVTCDGRELQHTTNYVLKLDVVEESTVMTSSFTTMLLALQHIAARVAGDEAFIEALSSLPKYLRPLLDTFAPKVEEFAKNDFQNISVLGQGALYGIASESALKVMESSSTYAQFFHTLEFRHGPQSIVGPGTLVGAMLSESGLDSEMPVLLEMKALGAKTFAVVNEAPAKLRNSVDLLIELKLPVPELARLAVYVVWGQLLGSYRGLEKGMDPDNPRHLRRVVTI